MMGRRYSLAIETLNGPDPDSQKEPIIGFLVDKDSFDSGTLSPLSISKSEKSKTSDGYSLCDLDTISQKNQQFKSLNSLTSGKRHVRRHAVAVKFQVPHSAKAVNVAGQS